MSRFEIEQKFQVPDLQACRIQIMDLFEVHRQSKVQQTDQYLFHPVRDFAATDEAFRIRSIKIAGQAECVCLTYKGPRLKHTPDSHEFKTRHEVEVPVMTDEDSLSKLSEMFSMLGFEPAMVVKKHRERLRIKFHGWDVEFALDQVQGLGAFLELEVVAQHDQIAEGQEILTSIVEQLGLSDPITDSYLELLQTQ